MSKWQAAYWGKEGVAVYQMAGERPAQLLYSGKPDELKLPGGKMQRRVLIVGRSHCIRLRKRYPPLKMDKLLRAVEMEKADLFPMENCSFHCRVVGAYATHVIVDIWAWERAPLERLGEGFAFRYVIPEDLAFIASPAGISIYPYGSAVQVIACAESQFVDAASYPAADFLKADLALFFTGLADGTDFIKEIRVYGDIPVDVPSALQHLVKRIQKDNRPAFLETADRISLKSFRFKAGASPLFVDRDTMLRFAIYTVLAYGLMLFLTLHDYDQALMDLKNKATAVEKEVSLLEPGSMLREDQGSIREVEAGMQEYVPPLRILDVLASELPKESSVSRLAMNSGVVEVTVTTRDPLAVIRRFSSSERIRKAALKGTPVKDGATGIYNCAFSLEMKS